MLFRRASLTSASLPALLLAGCLVLAGCDSGTDSTPKAAGGPSVIVPGKPGEENRTLSAEDAAEQRAEDDTPNSADVSFARMMIEHHGQALEMTALAPKQANSAQVKALASRIAATQGPEIEALRSWLSAHGEDDGSTADGASAGSTADGTSAGSTAGSGSTADGGHDHAAMPGMATEAQMGKLRAARGKAFDELFLTLMITHHEGALTMAADVKAQGNNIRVEEMADDVVAEQTTEITRMRAML
ncbi:DUF305 domain-containing protein [Streptomyces sp. NPDC088812]|uniref:DUF305 domain-containing protein n=1 Tax=Streptomyces sp. NPDC088812 TaxID=3365905 RepID=UPI003819243F